MRGGAAVRSAGRFEVQEVLSFGRKYGNPLGNFVILDSAIALARDLSFQHPAEIYVVSDKRELGDRPRGCAINGRWAWSVDCKICRGNESNVCKGCHGGGYRISEVP